MLGPELDGLEIYFSDVFRVAPEALEAYGAFNVSLINDLPLFVDPFLIFNSEKPDYQQLHEGILRYLRFLRDMAAAGSVSQPLLEAWYVFPEIRQNWLGFSRTGNRGSGLGLDFARALHENLNAVLSNFGNETITHSSHLEKVCLIKDGVGRDNISDFTTNLIQGYLLNYTQAFAREHIAPEQVARFRVNRSSFNYNTRSWPSAEYELPVYEDDFVLLTPKDILTRDETWISKVDMLRKFRDVAEAMPDDVLRAQLNQYFVRQLPEQPTKKDVRTAIVTTVRAYPVFMDHYIRFKEDDGEGATTVSNERVRGVERVFIDNLQRFAAEVRGATAFYSLRGDTYDEAKQRVAFLKDVIESKGGHRLFFDKNGDPIRRESDLQILFRLCWCATPSDVSREVNDGRGPVDFKVSMGAHDKTLVEFKLASNSQLKRNLEKQVEIYKKASGAKSALKVIIAFSEDELVKVSKVLNELGLIEHPDVVVIDADPSTKPSGSKA